MIGSLRYALHFRNDLLPILDVYDEFCVSFQQKVMTIRLMNSSCQGIFKKMSLDHVLIKNKIKKFLIVPCQYYLKT